MGIFGAGMSAAMGRKRISSRNYNGPSDVQELAGGPGGLIAKAAGMLGGDTKPMQKTDSVNYGRKPGASGSTFSKSSCDAGNQMFGDQQQRDMSMPIRNSSIENPLFMKDQTGDGKITYGDVVKARIEGYKE
tara:strand:+ start:177 stop:572 length:396 start_codon:yes stop_codon:yes gene_type:complete